MIVHAHVNIDSMNRGRWTDGCLFSLTSDVFEGHFPKVLAMFPMTVKIWISGDPIAMET